MMWQLLTLLSIVGGPSFDYSFDSDGNLTGLESDGLGSSWSEACLPFPISGENPFDHPHLSVRNFLPAEMQAVTGELIQANVHLRSLAFHLDRGVLISFARRQTELRQTPLNPPTWA